MTVRTAVTTKVVPKPEEVTLDEETMTVDRDDADSQLNPADKNALEMALSLKDDVGLAGSFTEVVELESIETSDRRGEWIEGDPAEQAAELARVVRDELG